MDIIQVDSESNESNKNENINVSEKQRVYKYCEKCGKQLEEESTLEFCDQWCRSEYFSEIRRENDALYREFSGRC